MRSTGLVDRRATSPRSPASSASRRKGSGWICLLYTSDAADERSSVDLGGRRIIKKKNKANVTQV